MSNDLINYTLYLPETTEVGTSVIQLPALGPNNFVLTYTLSEVRYTLNADTIQNFVNVLPNELFRIEKNSFGLHEIFADFAPNYERIDEPIGEVGPFGRVFFIDILASGDELPEMQTIRIDILDVDEAPIFAATTYVDGVLDHYTINETAPNQVSWVFDGGLSQGQVIHQALATDRDAGTPWDAAIDFELSGDDAALFGIVRISTGIAHIVALEDISYRDGRNFDIVLNASYGGLTNTQDVHIELTRGDAPIDVSFYAALSESRVDYYFDRLLEVEGGDGIWVNYSDEARTTESGVVLQAWTGTNTSDGSSVFSIPETSYESIKFWGSTESDTIWVGGDVANSEVFFKWSPGEDRFYLLKDIKEGNLDPNSNLWWSLYPGGDGNSLTGVYGNDLLTVTSNLGTTVINNAEFWDSMGDDTVYGTDAHEIIRVQSGGHDLLTLGDGPDTVRLRYEEGVNTNPMDVYVTDWSSADRFIFENMGLNDSEPIEPQVAVSYDAANDQTLVSVNGDDFSQANVLRLPGNLSIASYELLDIARDDRLAVTFYDPSLPSVIYGTEDADRNLTGTPGADFLYGLGGDDWFYLTKGADHIDGGEGYDRIDLRALSQAVTVNADEGIAYGAEIGQTTFVNIERVHGGDGNDTLIGVDSKNHPYYTSFYETLDFSFTGGGGDDYIEGRGDFDFVWYGGAPASISVDLESGVVTGGEGNDTLVGIEWIRGTNYSDTLLGSSADNIFFDDALNDKGAPNYTVGGSDYIDGRGGVDTLMFYVNDSPADNNLVGLKGVIVDMKQGSATDSAGNTDNFINIENIVGTSMSDVVLGDANDNWIATDLGNDVVSVGIGADFAMLGGGDDQVTLTADGIWSNRYSAVHVSDDVSVGTGQRIALGGKNRFDDVVWGQGGQDSILLTDGDDVLALDDRYSGYNERALVNSDGTDLMRNTARVDGFEEIFAGAGNDVIDLTSVTFGASAGVAARLYGEAGDDVLWSGRGNDFLLGGEGNDRLNGGVGNDELTGGLGADIFEFTSTSGSDVITDFDVDNDLIHIYTKPGDTQEVTFSNDTITWGTVSIQLQGLSASSLTLGDDILLIPV